MRARQLTKRIEIWELTSVFDGVSGYNLTDTLIASSWASVKTFQAGKYSNLSDFGIVDGQNAVQFTLRKRNDLIYNLNTMYIKYRGVKYTISTSPTNIDFNDKQIVFIGVAEVKKTLI